MRARIDRLRRAYREGLRAPVEDFSPGEEGRDLLLAFAAILGLDELVAIRRGGALRSQALAAVRREDTEAAETLLRRSEEVGRGVLSPVGRAVERSLAEPAWAYLAYRTGSFAEAKQRVRAGLSATESLESEHGLARLEGRRIHLARNLARVHRIAGELDEAAAALAGLLGFCAGVADAWPLPTARPGLACGGLKPAVSALLAGQLTGELALLFAGWDAAATLHLASEVRRTLGRAEPAPSWRPRVEGWLGAKAALAHGDRRLCLERLPAVLARGRGPMALAWHSAVFDLHRACRDDPRPAARDLRREVASDSRAFGYLPPELLIPSGSPADPGVRSGSAGRAA